MKTKSIIAMILVVVGVGGLSYVYTAYIKEDKE